MDLATWLLESGEEGDDALVAGDERLTRAQLREAVARQAERLTASGVGAGCVWDVRQPSSLSGVLSYLGALRVGAQAALWPQAVPLPSVKEQRTLRAESGVQMFTSGSTSAPTAILLDSRNLMANAEGILQRIRLHPSDSVLCALPIEYSFGLSLLNTALRVGATAHLSPGEHGASSIVDEAQRAHATVIGAVPTLAHRLAKHVETLADVRSLRMVQLAGGRFSPSILRTLLGGLPEHVAVHVMYGLTEATARVTTVDIRSEPDAIGSVGRPIEGVTVHIEREDGSLTSLGEDGRVVVGGACVSPWVARQDGCFVTGDVGHVDAAGLLWIVGRTGSFVKVGGRRYSLCDVEDLVQSMPEVELAAAAAVPDSLYGERVAVVVQPTGDDLDVERVLAECASRLPRPLRPVCVRLVPEMPITTNGKVDRARLGRLLESGPADG